MIEVAETLPTEVPVLHRMVVDEREKVAHLEQEVSLLREQLTLLKAGKFGPRSEAVPPDQYRLFNEAEELAQQAPAEEDEPETTEVKGYKRKKAVRKPLPEDLPRRDVSRPVRRGEVLPP